MRTILYNFVRIIFSVYTIEYFIFNIIDSKTEENAIMI